MKLLRTHPVICYLIYYVLFTVAVVVGTVLQWPVPLAVAVWMLVIVLFMHKRGYLANAHYQKNSPMIASEDPLPQERDSIKLSTACLLLLPPVIYVIYLLIK